MILKIVEDRNEYIFEADAFEIRSYEEEMLGEFNATQKNVCQSPMPQPWYIIHKDRPVVFDCAYLMNNDGKTIQRYG